MALRMAAVPAAWLETSDGPGPPIATATRYDESLVLSVRYFT